MFLDTQIDLVSYGDISKYIKNIYPDIVSKISPSDKSLTSYSNIIMPGINKYATNALFEAGYRRDTSLFLVAASDYPDALAGAVLPAQLHWGGYVILTDPNTLQPETISTLNDLAYFEHNPQQWPDPSRRFYPTLYVLGGPGAVSDAVVQQAQQILSSDGYPKS